MKKIKRFIEIFISIVTKNQVEKKNLIHQIS